MSKNYGEIYRQSIDNADEFWGEAAKEIHWDKFPTKILSQVDGKSRWFEGGELNTCYNAIDRHIANGKGDDVAIYYDSPVTNTKQRFTYSELKTRVAKVAGMLQSVGVCKGDTVIIYMPMIPEAAIAMLGCARIGAVHSVVFGGFAAHELAVRIEDAKPKVVLSASCGIEISNIIHYKPLLDEAIEQSSYKPSHCFIYQREQELATLIEGRDLHWQEEEAKAEEAPCVSVKATDPLYILYTSGTTGKPKGVIRDNGGHAVAIKWSLENIYNCKEGQVFWSASDVGWVVGHSYIVYGPLINGCSTVIYEGKPIRTPNAGAFWRVCEEYGVNVLFTAPTAFRAVKKEDPKGELAKKYNTDKLNTIFLAGERCDSDTLEWIKAIAKKPVIDNWWQTETGWPIAANPLGIEPMPVKAGSPTVPMPGFQVEVLSEEAVTCKPNELGNIVIKLPLPPSCLVGIWGNEARFQKSYLDHYPGYYLTGDAGYIDEDGYLWVMGRMDGTLTTAGHRLSTGALEETIATHQAVAECAVIGANDEIKGEIPIGFLVLKEGVTKSDSEIIKEVIELVRHEIGAVASFKIATIVKRLPKTRSGKILRGTMRSIADGKEWNMPSTIEDVSVMPEMKEVIGALGYPKK